MRDTVKTLSLKNGQKIHVKARDLTVKGLFKLAKSKDPDMKLYAKRRLKEIYSKGGISNEGAKKRMQLIKKGLGLTSTQDIFMNNKAPNKWLNAASTDKLVGEEVKVLKTLINPVKIQKGKVHPLSGSEPDFAKWLWSGRPEFIHSNNCYAYATNQFRFYRPQKAMPGYNRKSIKESDKSDIGENGMYNNMDCKLLTKSVLKDAGSGYVCKDPYEKCKKGT